MPSDNQSYRMDSFMSSKEPSKIEVDLSETLKKLAVDDFTGIEEALLRERCRSIHPLHHEKQKCRQKLAAILVKSSEYARDRTKKFQTVYKFAFWGILFLLMAGLAMLLSIGWDHYGYLFTKP